MMETLQTLVTPPALYLFGVCVGVILAPAVNASVALLVGFINRVAAKASGAKA